jgi:hypothetical protein
MARLTTTLIVAAALVATAGCSPKPKQMPPPAPAPDNPTDEPGHAATMSFPVRAPISSAR